MVMAISETAHFTFNLPMGNLLIISKYELENKLLPDDIDYLNILGLRLEARQKLDKIRPQNLGQASRISGVSPADITVLMLYLKG